MTAIRMVSESEHLSEIVGSVNSRSENLVASSEETAASVDMMRSVTQNVEESLKQLLESF